MKKKEIKYSLITNQYICKLVNELTLHQLTLIGLKSKKFLMDILTDAVNYGNPNVIIALNIENKIVGWNIAIINSKKYWINFLLTHSYYIPFYILRQIKEKLYTKYIPINRNSVQIKPPLLNWKKDESIHWGESNANVARHIDINVIENYQDKHIGTYLQSIQIDVLQRKKVHRIDACISKNNIKSQIFHSKRNWILVREDNSMLYIVKKI